MSNETHSMIDDFVIQHIENALGMKLYSGQVKYLTGEFTTPDYDSLRGTGKTTAYCIKLALTSGPPLDLRHPATFSDARYSGIKDGDYGRYSRYFFVNKFMTIREKLLSYGFSVREVIYPKR